MAPHIVSRCAPASEPPTMARGSCHTSARRAQSASDSPMGGRSPVRRSSATTTSSSASKGVTATLAGHVADAAALRAPCSPGRRSRRGSADPTAPGAAGCRPRRTAHRRRGAGASRGRRTPPSAARAGARRPRATPAGRRGWRRARSSAESAWCGAASARRTVAPRSAAARPRSQLAPRAVGVHGRHPEDVPVDRAVGQQGHGGHEVDLVLGEPVEAAGDDELDASCPRAARTAAARRSISARLAARDGTGWPSPSLCVCTCEVEKPSAPSCERGVQRRLHGIDVRAGRGAPDGAARP